MKKLENLISFDDFKTNWKGEQSKNTKRTSTGIDILKEGVDDGIEEIIPEGLPDEDYNKQAKFGLGDQEKIEQINNFLDNDADEGVVDDIVEQLRDALLEMEQQGFVDESTTDELDDKHDGDWINWIKDVIELPDFPEEVLNNIIEVIDDSTDPDNLEYLSGDDLDDVDSDEENDEEDDDVECPDCDGTGLDENGEDCERCEGEGRVYRPDDIPPDR